MNTKTLLILSVVFMITFSLSGCLGDDEAVASTSSEALGLTLEFQPGAPPDQISEDDISFDISVKLENSGEYDLAEYYEDDTTGETVGDLVSVFLLGVNPATLGLCEETDEGTVCHTEQPYIEGLSGAHYVNSELIPGQVNYINWYQASGESPEYGLDITSDQTLNFVAQLCYPYKTITTAEACFSDNAYAQATGAETCVVSGEKEPVNSMAPIQITKIVENPAGRDGQGVGKYAFTFTIENLGGGTVFPYTKSVHDCTSLGVADLNANQVAVTSVSVGGEDKINCLRKIGVDETSGEDILAPATITLVDGKGTFTCTLSQGTVTGDYSDIIQVNMVYNYYTQTKKEIVVKNTLDFE
jgi:hypothetical protein